MMLHKVTQDLLVLGREAVDSRGSCRVALSNAFQASPVRISSRNDRNAASSGRTQHHHMRMCKMSGLFALTMVTMSPEVPSPCTLPIQSGFGATSRVATSDRFMSHPWMRSPSVSS